MLRAAYRLPLDRPLISIQPLGEMALAEAADSVEPGQDWEVGVDFLPAAPLDLPSFYHRLESMGTSIQVGEGDGLYRMHIHVPDTTQFLPVEYVHTLGTVTNVHLENLMDQVASRAKNAAAAPLRLAKGEPGQRHA